MFSLWLVRLILLTTPLSWVWWLWLWGYLFCCFHKAKFCSICWWPIEWSHCPWDIPSSRGLDVSLDIPREWPVLGDWSSVLPLNSLHETVLFSDLLDGWVWMAPLLVISVSSSCRNPRPSTVMQHHTIRPHLYMSRRNGKLLVGRIPFLPSTSSLSWPGLWCRYPFHSFVGVSAMWFLCLLVPLLVRGTVVFLSRKSSWWKSTYCRSCVHLLSFVFHTTQLSSLRRASSELCLSWSSMESHKYTVIKSRVPHQHLSPL